MTDDLARLLAILRDRLIHCDTMTELVTLQGVIDDYTGGVDPRPLQAWMKGGDVSDSL